MTLPAERPGVVFDCNVTIQAISNESGPSGRSLALLERGGIDVFLSRAILRELRRVLEYPSVRGKLPNLTDDRIEQFIQRLVFRAVLLRRVRHLMDYPRARQDEPYLDAAWTAGADYLVSRDNDLLALVTDHTAVGKEFRRRCPKLRITNPVDFLLRFERVEMRN
jgi:putative PIN family toxin of toxin-antitoxin system